MQLVRPTDCPQVAALRDDYSIVVTSHLQPDAEMMLRTGFPSGTGEIGYLGRVVNGEDMTLEDAFLMTSQALLVRDGHRIDVKLALGFYAPMGTGVTRLVLSPHSWKAMYRLSDVPEIVTKQLREVLVKSWDMRNALRAKSPTIITAAQ